MKPKKLIMSAFCPYAEQVEIDFETFDNSGLVLISGETGAGKTTVFDGISYALYGKVSGENRGEDGLRSDFAKSEIPTFVYLTFEHKGQLYEVERSPRYYRPKKRGGNDEMTLQNPTAKLTLPDKVIDRVKEVDEKIVELLGINHQQFKQIVMIAQGEFLKLLLSDSNERGDILRKVFDTELFNKIQFRLKNRRKELGIEMEKMKASVNQYYESIICTSEEEKEQLEHLKENIYRLPDMLAFLTKLIEQMECKLDQAQQEKNGCEKEAAAVSDKLSLLGQWNEALENILINQSFVDGNRAVLKEKREKLASLRKQEPEREKLSNEISEIRKMLPLYKEAADKQAELNKQEAENRINKDRQKELAVQIAGRKKLQQQIEEELVQLEDIEVEKNDILHRYEQGAALGETLAGFQTEYQNCTEQSQLWKQYVEAYQAAEHKYSMANQEYAQLERYFFAEQAGILAELLEKERPCPVCGSKEHPDPAEKSEQAPTQSQLEDKKKALEHLRKKLDNVSQKASAAGTKLETMKAALMKKIQELDQNHPVMWEAAADTLSERLQAQKEEQKKLLEIRNSVAKKWNYKKDLMKRQEQLRQALEKEEALLEQIKNELMQSEKMLSKLGAERKSLEKNLLYENITEASKHLDIKQNRLQQMKQELEHVDAVCRKLEEQMAAAQAVIKNEEKRRAELAGTLQLGVTVKEKVSLVSVQEQKAAISIRIKQTDEIISNLKHEIKTNKNIYENLGKCRAQYEEKEALYSEIKLLSDTANGELSGKRQKITFETYVQQVYFDMVLVEANVRFLSMTDNRYTLVRKEDPKDYRSKTGLDLDVADAWTGKRRAAKSLSGGESFKASLALALGLSDVVQRFSGGVTLDTMFIDEGFGTLDSESLEKAMEIIAQLADGRRLVGIISHVDELKERIDSKILIERDKQGSKISFQT